MAAAQTSEFDFEGFIGHGSFCQVERCVHRATGSSYAAKRVVKSKPHVLQGIVMEESPWVVQMAYEIDLEMDEWIGILELCEARDAAHPEVPSLGRSVHSFGLDRGEVQGSNPAPPASPSCPTWLQKLFGVKRSEAVVPVNHFSRVVTRTMMLGPQYEHHVGTPNFMSPEAIEGTGNDRRSDLWSLGCAIYQLLLGAAPFNAPTPFMILTKAQAGQLWIPSTGMFSAELQLIQQLTTKDPAARLGASSTRHALEGGLCRAVVAESDSRALEEDPPPAGECLFVADAAQGVLAQLGVEEMPETQTLDEVLSTLRAAGLGDNEQVVLWRSVELAEQRLKESRSFQLECPPQFFPCWTFPQHPFELKESRETFSLGGSENSSEATDEEEAEEEGKDSAAVKDASQLPPVGEASPRPVPEGQAAKCCELMKRLSPKRILIDPGGLGLGEGNAGLRPDQETRDDPERISNAVSVSHGSEADLVLVVMGLSMSIILMNILIGVLAESYNRGWEHRERLFLLERSRCPGPGHRRPPLGIAQVWFAFPKDPASWGEMQTDAEGDATMNVHEKVTELRREIREMMHGKLKTHQEHGDDLMHSSQGFAARKASSGADLEVAEVLELEHQAHVCLDHADAVRLAPLSTAATVATARVAKIKPCGSCGVSRVAKGCREESSDGPTPASDGLDDRPLGEEISFWQFLAKEPDADTLPLKQRIPEVALFRGCSLYAGFFSNQRGLLQKRSNTQYSKQFLLDRLLALSAKTADATDLCARTPAAILRRPQKPGMAGPPKTQVLNASQLMELLERTERGSMPGTFGLPAAVPQLEEDEDWSLQSLIVPQTNLRVVSVYSREANGEECLDLVGQPFSQVYPIDGPEPPAPAPAGPPRDPSLRSVFIPEAFASQVEMKSRHLAAYVQRFHGRALASLISEFIPDESGKAVLHGFWKVELLEGKSMAQSY
ncbi:unnamed protein product, partial [Durusdinium trenchii]